MGNGVASIPPAATIWLLCKAAEYICALPSEQVVEVMRLLPIRAIAQAPPFVRGIATIRGQSVPVVDVGLLLGTESVSARYLVTVRVDERQVALAMDRIIDVRQLPKAGAEMPPLLSRAAGEAITSIEALDHELLLRLKTARLVPNSVLQLDLQGPS
jgi:purine-binding chemotaxis protein CheW